MTNKYKVIVKLTSSYAIDVLADNEDEARELAQYKFAELMNAGIEHFDEDEPAEWNIEQIFDVTNTDDSFNP